MTYKVADESEKPDMRSLVIECKKLDEPIDSTGVLGSDHSNDIDTEVNLALKFLEKISNAKDIDALLSSNQALKKRMIDEVLILLDSSGYNTDEYPFHDG